MEPVNSTTFIKKPPSLSDKQECILYAKEILSGRLFLGYYKERRYVSELMEYRDLIIISPEEIELHHDLKKVLQKFYRIQGFKWVGITGPEVVGVPKAYCFWVKLSNLAFGDYWFQIKHVKLVDEEIILQLKYIRKALPSSTKLQESSSVEDISFTSKQVDIKPRTGSSNQDYPADFDPKKLLTSMYLTCKETYHIIRPQITWNNCFTVLRVTCALVITVVMGSISCVQSLSHFSLKLLRELSLLVNALTPIIIQLIDFFTKIVGGFYILLAWIFMRNGQRMGPPFPNTRNIPFASIRGGSPRKALDWKERNRALRQELLFNQKGRYSFVD